MKKLLLLLFTAFLFCGAYAQNPEGLFNNSKAFDFRLKDQNGAEVNLKDLRKKGPVVLLFIRGSWSPFCVRELRAFQDSLSFIQAKNAQVVVITPEMKEGIDSIVQKSGATFPVLYDEGMKVTANYQGAFPVDEKTLSRYKMAGIDLLKANGQKEAMLPVTAVYIINKEGSVTYRFFDENYRRRPPVREVLANLK